MESHYPPETAIPVFMGCFIFFIAAVAMVISVIVYCKIFGKAGYHWALGLIVLVPFGNLVLLLILAFGEWPIQRQLRECQRGSAGPSPEPGKPTENFRNL